MEEEDEEGRVGGSQHVVGLGLGLGLGLPAERNAPGRTPQLL